MTDNEPTGSHRGASAASGVGNGVRHAALTASGGLLRSVRFQGGLLAVILTVLPCLLYVILADGQRAQRELLQAAVNDAGRAIAAGLGPELRGLDPTQFSEIQARLSVYSDPGRRIALLWHPLGGFHADSFFYVASNPQIAPEALEREKQRLTRLSVLPALAQNCAADVATPPPQIGDRAVITSISTVPADNGCWAVVVAVASRNVVAGLANLPFWAAHSVQFAAAIYGVMALLIVLIFATVSANLARFRRIALGDAPSPEFADATTVPEIAPVARAIDVMVRRLHSTAQTLRQSAEDNAHAFKGPIATIRQATEPLLRLSAEDEASRGALRIVLAALDRLDGLVQSARRLDAATADLLELSERNVDLTALLSRLVGEYRAMHDPTAVRLTHDLESDLVVAGEVEIIETVCENLLENAIAFSPKGGTVAVSAGRMVDESGRHFARIRVEDDGPGVPAEALERIFERYYSDRKSAPGGGDDGQTHFGIGLWIARQNAQAMFGSLTARNRQPHGLCAEVRLPM
jgi:two-component system, OmpR family, sensor histidine kinase ChvG